MRWLIVEQTDVMPGIGGLRFRLVTGRLAPDDPDVARRRSVGEDVLGSLEEHLRRRDFLVDEYSIADIAVYAYSHVAEEATVDGAGYPNFRSWLARVEATPGFMNDLEPYPPNARPGAGRSVYDATGA
jgi:glutathione S-transferase